MYNKEKNALVAECKTVSSTTDLIFQLLLLCLFILILYTFYIKLNYLKSNLLG